MTKQGWVCPRCSRVYAPTTAECRACNEAITVARQLGTGKRRNVYHGPNCPCDECGGIVISKKDLYEVPPVDLP